MPDGAWIARPATDWEQIIANREARRRELRAYIGRSAGRGTCTWSKPSPGRVLAATRTLGKTLEAYGFVLRESRTGPAPTYEGHGLTATWLADHLPLDAKMPIPAIVPGSGPAGGSAVLAMRKAQTRRFGNLLGLSDQITENEELHLSGPALAVRRATLAPWLVAELRNGAPFTPERLARALWDPPVPPFLEYLPSRRSFLILDGGIKDVAKAAAKAGFTEIAGSKGAHESSAPSAALQCAALADGNLRATLEALATLWPFGFHHLVCNDVHDQLDKAPGESRPEHGKKATKAAREQQRPIDYDPSSGCYTCADAPTALRLGLPELSPITAAALDRRRDDGKRRPWWGFQDTAAALKFRDCLSDDAENETMCRLLEGCKGQRSTTTENPPEPRKGIAYDEFQIEGIRHCRSSPTTLLADDMGLGKTVQGTALADMARADHKDNCRVLVIAPADQLENWTRSLTGIPQTPFKVIRLDPPEPGKSKAEDLALRVPKHTKDPWAAGKGAAAVLVSWGTVTNRPDLTGLGWHLILLDEAHCAKTPGAARTRALLGDLAGDCHVRADRMVWMTGTDITDTPMDLYPFCATAVRRAGGEPTPPDRFAAIMGTKRGGGEAAGPAAVRRLARLAEALDSGPRIRRLKEDVYGATLRPKSAKAWLVDLQDENAAAQAAAEGETWDALTAGRLEPAERRVALRSLASSRLQTALAKVPFVARAVARVARPWDPILLYAHHTAAADALHHALLAAGVDAVVAHGRNTGPRERARMAEAFQAGRWEAFISTIAALYAGHTLTRTRHVWFLELDHKGRLVEQCVDRAWRRGQQRTVRARFFHVAGSYDGRIATSILAKSRVAGIATGDDRRRMDREAARNKE